MHKSLTTSLTNFGAPSKLGDVGVELEVEGRHLPTILPEGWLVKAEDSLRGEGGRVVRGEAGAVDQPREYVSARPVGLPTLMARLQELHKLLTTRPVEVRLTYRASTHIHLNMGGETLSTLLAFVSAFAIAEPVLLRLCGNERNGNLFCMPLYETGDAVFAVQQLERLVTRQGFEFRRGKYASLNLDPLFTLGSVEARCFPNTISPELVHRWAGWLVNLRSLAREVSAEGDFGTMIDAALLEPWTFLDRVFGPTERNAIRIACAPTEPARLVEFGAETAYEVWKASQSLYRYDDKKKQKVVEETPDSDGLLRTAEPQGWYQMPDPDLIRRAGRRFV